MLREGAEPSSQWKVFLYIMYFFTFQGFFLYNFNKDCKQKQNADIIKTIHILAGKNQDMCEHKPQLKDQHILKTILVSLQSIFFLPS